jgi:hypothetical protein
MITVPDNAGKIGKNTGKVAASMMIIHPAQNFRVAGILMTLLLSLTLALALIDVMERVI